MVRATHICFCAQAHPDVRLPNFKVIEASLAEYFKLEKKTRLRSDMRFTTGKDKQQHMSPRFLSQPGAADGSGGSNCHFLTL